MPPCAFVLGAPRSGTSWLQFMLGSHPDVVTPQELDVFSRYLPPLWDAWEHELARTPEDRLAGLTTALTQEQFEDELRVLAAGVYEHVLALKPGATLVVEKDPAYSLHVSLIDRLVPDARYVHVIRDGRDVAASLVSASRSWGRRWAPGSTRPAAQMWRSYVERAREAQAFSGRYLEVRYEALLERGAEELRLVFEFLGIDVDAQLCNEIFDGNSFSTLAAQGALSPSVAYGGEALRRFGQVSEPAGFFRAGRAGGWRATLTKRDQRVCREVMGDLLVSLGYESTGTVTPAIRALSAVRGGARHYVRGGARRLGRKLSSWGSA